MPRRNHRQANRSDRSPLFLGRRRWAKRSAVLVEALEQRRLLSGYTFTLANQGSGTANGTYLQALINGTTTITGDGATNHTVTLGDTLILPDGVDYDMAGGNFNLPNLGAAAIVSETGGMIQNTAHMTFDGGGYTSAPTVVFMDTTGSGAIGTATLGTGAAAGTVTGITITNGGANYSTNVTIALVGGTQTLTIESSGYNAGDLGSGRFTPTTATVADLATISGTGVDDGMIVETVLSDSYNHSGAAQNYAFDGIEICPDLPTDYFNSGLVAIGLSSSAQDYNPLVPSNFTFNQDYIHGGSMGETSDDLNTAVLLDGTILRGFELNANYVTVENTQITDIHGYGLESQDINGWNALGNFVINNDYLEATGEDIIFGGARIYLPSPAQPNNITITNNYFTKNAAWNPALPQYAGVSFDVKNDLEFKTATNVTVSNNLFENVWVGADQRGEAINISHIDQDQNGDQPWINVANVTITDNVFRNVGQVLEVAAGEGDQFGGEGGDYGPSEISYNITFDNNLAYDLGGLQWGVTGSEWALQITSNTAPTNNLTIENNTIIGTNGYGLLESNSNSTIPVAANFLFINNVIDESNSGLEGNDVGTDKSALNSLLLGALTITDPGSGYSSTAPPTVTISGGGGSGATAVAVVCAAGFPQAGQIIGIEITHAGTGYNSAPTVSISPPTSGTTATATALFPVNDDGGIHGYDFEHNVIIGGTAANYPDGGADNYFPTTENAAGLIDVAGDEYGLYPGSTYHADGTGGSTPGVNLATLLAADSTGVIPWQPADDPTPATPILQNYYKFDEGTGTSAYDSSTYVNNGGTPHNATINGTYTWNTTGPQGGGISFTGGTSGNVSVSSFTSDSSFTFAAWVKPTSISGTQYIASTANSAFSLYLNSGVLTATGTNTSIKATGSTLVAGQWSLVTVTFSSGTLTLYVNGIMVGSATSVTTTTGTTTLYIGGDQGSVNSFNGTIDEVRYYNSVLSGVWDVLGDTNHGLAGGTGYNSSTNGFALSFSGGGGSGAAATAYADNSLGEITQIIFTNPGSGYTSAPILSFTNGAGSGALDTAFMSPSPISYLYQQYGPQFENTFYYPTSGSPRAVTGTTATLDTTGLAPDENYSNIAYAWSLVIMPQGNNFGPPTIDGTTSGPAWNVPNPTVTFAGAGIYLFKLVITNSLEQSATVYMPVPVAAVATTPVISVTPSSFSIALNSTENLTANTTASTMDQFGNIMSTTGWSWATDVGTGSITTSTYDSATYKSPTSGYKTYNNGIILDYITADGLIHAEATATPTIVDASTPSAPATISIAPGTNNSNVISWTAPSGGGQTGYYILSSTDNNNDYTTLYNDTSSSAISWTDTTEMAGSLLYYEVQAYNDHGGGGTAGPVAIVTGAPAAPTNLVATGGFNNSVALTWTNTAGTNATSATVLRSTDSNESDAIGVGSLAGTAASWTDDAANDPGNAPIEGTLYYYWVETNNTYTSIPSNSSSATPIGAPTGLTATAISDNQASVSWIDPSNVPSYYVQYENANGGSWSAPISVSAGNTTYLLTTGLGADTQYNFEVEAYDAAGNSGWSSPVSARTWNTAATPTVYEGFNYPANAGLIGQSGGVGWSAGWAKDSADTGNAIYNISPDQPKVTQTSAFSGSTNAANFLLTTGDSFFSGNSGGGVRTLATAIPNTSGTTVWASVVIDDATSGNYGYVELLGNNTSGGTNNVEFGLPVSNEFSIDVPGINGWGGSTAPVVNNTYLCVLEIQYHTSGTASTLTMFVDPDPTQPSSSWTPAVTVTPTLANLNNIDSVEIWGSANNSNNLWDELRIGSTASSVVPPTLPTAPTGLMATPGASSIALSWNSASSTTSFVQGYDVWRSTTSATSGFSLDTTVGSSTLGYIDSSVTAGTTYYYEVTAENTTGDSINSTVASAIYNPLPGAPSALAANPGTSAIALTWTDPSNTSNVTGYHVWRSTDNATWGSVYATITGATATSYTDPSPTSGTGYYYKVTAYNSAGDSTTAAGMTNAVFTVYAYEGFNYATTGSNGWTGANTTGIGFTGNWTVNYTNHANIVAGLTYNSGTSGLTTSGNALQIGLNDYDLTATQTLSNSVGSTVGSTLWVGFLVNTNTPSGDQCGLQIGTGTSTGYVKFMVAGNNTLTEWITTNGNNSYSPTGYAGASNTTYFIVGKITYNSTSPVITMYVDPTPNSVNGATPTGELATITETIPSTAGSLGSTTFLDLYTDDVTGTLDEVRLGPTYASVAPDPKVAGTNASGKKSPRGHRHSPFLAGVATPNDSKASRSTKPATQPNRFYSGLDGGSWQWADAANDVDGVLLGTASKNGLFN